MQDLQLFALLHSNACNSFSLQILEQYLLSKDCFGLYFVVKIIKVFPLKVRAAGTKVKLLAGASLLFIVVIITVRGLSTLLSRGHNNTTQVSIAASCASSYTSLSNLTNSASDIIVGKVLPQNRVVHVGAIPFALTSIKVQKIVKGTTTSMGTTITLRQLGPGGSDTQPLVRRGNTMLLFLSPFALTPGQPIQGQYVDRGCGQGLYVASTTNVGTFVSMGSSVGHLPRKVTLNQVASILGSKD